MREARADAAAAAAAAIPAADAARADPVGAWLTEAEVACCMVADLPDGCGSSKTFGAFRWRHRCGYCGWVVCTTCIGEGWTDSKKNALVLDRRLVEAAATLADAAAGSLRPTLQYTVSSELETAAAELLAGNTAAQQVTGGRRVCVSYLMRAPAEMRPRAVQQEREREARAAQQEREREARRQAWQLELRCTASFQDQISAIHPYISGSAGGTPTAELAAELRALCRWIAAHREAAASRWLAYTVR